MANKWESTLLHEHPAKHQAGTFGKIILTNADVYALKVGASMMSCPQDWAARIHAQEQEQDETSYILKGIPADLWHQAKVRAAEERITLKDVLLNALQNFVKVAKPE